MSPSQSTVSLVTATDQYLLRSAPRKRYTFSEWIVNFLAADLEAYEAGLGYDGDAVEDMAGLDEWNSAASGGLGDEYYGDNWDDIDDGFLETLIILGLAATLGLLVWYRQQRQLRERREREARENAAAAPAPAPAAGGLAAHQPPQERGMFPPPGDPEFLQWAAGGIGH